MLQLLCGVALLASENLNVHCSSRLMGALFVPKQEKTKLERNATALGHYCADHCCTQASATVATRLEGTALGSVIG